MSARNLDWADPTNYRMSSQILSTQSIMQENAERSLNMLPTLTTQQKNLLFVGYIGINHNGLIPQDVVVLIISFAADPLIYSVILKHEEPILLQFLSQQLNEKQFRFNLLFRYNRDGPTRYKFHALCDGKKHLLFIIKTKRNHIFGGYTSVPWQSSGGYKTDKKAFIFLLKSCFDHKPKMVSLKKNGKCAVYHDYNYGPQLGYGAIALQNWNDKKCWSQV
eukprot:UN07210